MKTNFEDGPCSTRNRAESIFHRAMSNSGPEDSRRILERLTANFYLFSYLFIIVRNVENKRFRFRSLRLNMYIVKYVMKRDTVRLLKNCCRERQRYKLFTASIVISATYRVHRWTVNNSNDSNRAIPTRTIEPPTQSTANFLGSRLRACTKAA